MTEVSGHKAGVGGIYNQATYLKEKKATVATWADLLAAVEGKDQARTCPEVN